MLEALTNFSKARWPEKLCEKETPTKGRNLPLTSSLSRLTTCLKICSMWSRKSTSQTSFKCLHEWKKLWLKPCWSTKGEATLSGCTQLRTVITTIAFWAPIARPNSSCTRPSSATASTHSKICPRAQTFSIMSYWSPSSCKKSGRWLGARLPWSWNRWPGKLTSSLKSACRGKHRTNRSATWPQSQAAWKRSHRYLWVPKLSVSLKRWILTEI